MYKKIVLITLSFIILITIIGYLLSDQIYYARIISEAKLQTPKNVFKWVRKNNPSAINTKTLPAAYVSPKYNIINKRKLYCDESAIVMATLIHQLGYKTRLINLIGMDGISHHTILEVYEGHSWKTYDHFKGKYYSSHQKLAGYPLLKIEINSYPKTYNLVINNNYFLKKLAFLVRGIQEPN